MRYTIIALLLATLCCRNELSHQAGSTPDKTEAYVRGLLAQGRCDEATRALAHHENDLGAHWYVLSAAAQTDCFRTRHDPRYKTQAEAILREGKARYPTSSLLLQQGAATYLAFGELALATRYRSDAEALARKNLSQSGTERERRDDERVLQESGLTVYRTPVTISEPSTIVIQDGKRVR